MTMTTATPASGSDLPYYSLTVDEVCRELDVNPDTGLGDAEVLERRAQIRPEQACRGGQGARLEGVPSPVQGFDADRPRR